ncbi:DUF5642 family protein [Mycobacterium sp.]|uniref:DUF5642 family protein n=1 Tax=Mycobacterium sp. TaxID=1785 RepID=UPI0031DB38BE
MCRRVLALAAVCAAAACSSGSGGHASADITKIADVKSSFGPGFQVKDIAKTGVDPQVLSSRKLPEGLKFEPANCAKFVIGEQVPPGVQGNMAAVTAEGDGARYIAIALQTSQPVPLNDPGRNCKKVAFQGRGVRGFLEVVEAPQIKGVRTLGVHRILQTIAGGRPRTGEMYNYSAHFGDYQVIVTANPLVAPDRPVAAVDTQRARDLLTAAVAAVRT